MDGTLTEPGQIDFAAIFRRCGLDPRNGDILSQIKEIPDSKRREEAMEIVIEVRVGTAVQ
jgi:hypothetical protein